MGLEENKANVRRQIDECWNKGDYSGIPEMISPDYVYHSVRDFTGQEGFKQIFIIWRTACPDIHAVIEELVGEDNTVVMSVSWKGTFTGNFLEFEPTGNKIDMKEVWVHHFDDGKVVEATPYANLLSLFRQMGITPTN